MQRETWLLSPAGSVARTRFDELSAQFPDGPRTYPIVTRVLATLALLLRERQLLGFLPISLVRPLVDAGELVVLPPGATPQPEAIAPIGLLHPDSGLRRSTQALVDFLQGWQAGR